MRTQLKINGELKDVEIENGEITIIELGKKETGWEFSTRPYYITAGGVTGNKPLNYDGMNKISKTANAFSSEELAESINRMQTLLRNMFRWQAENDEPINREQETQRKYVISYEHETNDFKVYFGINTDNGFLPYFTTVEKAEICIDVFRDELIWLFTKFKWRMDG